MNDFMQKSPEYVKLEEMAQKAEDFLKLNKHVEAAEIFSEILKEFEQIPVEVKNQVPPEFNENFELEVRGNLSLCKFKIEDYDSAIEEGLKVLEKKPIYDVYLRVGISYFKKGKYYKARDNLLKAKGLFTGEPEKIRKEYIFNFSTKLFESNIGYDCRHRKLNTLT
jgi:tetratricopeptide (TPR) repeat protein